MIKIHDKLWYVIKPEDKENLAYMCQYQTDKEDNPLSNVIKMQATGRSWARIYTGANYHERIPVEGEEFIVDNTPTSGFYVGCSVSRWSTSNKLFRVKDPRGFTVEIPTDNLATLLHHTTVVKGVVQEECVWGREGNNHILLPVNSEPYLITLDQMDTLENKLISLKDLKVGDWVNLFEDETEYYYAGKIKGTWKLRGYTYETSWAFSTYGQRKNTQYSDWIEIKDAKWTDVFLRKIGYETTNGSKYSVQTFSKPKIVEVVKHEKMNVAAEEYSWYCPQRVKNQSNLSDRWSYVEAELIGVEYKK